MARNIYVPLPEPARQALYDLAEREWRNPKEQASKLLVEGLCRAGVLANQGPVQPLTTRPTPGVNDGP